MSILDFRKEINEITSNIGKKKMGLPSGISMLDDILLGFSPGEMITIAGRPGLGKSSLARDILLAVGKPNTNSGVAILCTLEMGCEEVAELIVANLAKVDYNKVSRGESTDRDKSHIETARKQLSAYNIIINDDSFLTPVSIRQMLFEIQEKEPIACLLIDYLQLMSLRKPVESRQTEVATISRELKAIAREFNIPVIAFSQLNRNVEYRESAKPRMVDLRESGSIENDSSKIILIHRPSYYSMNIDSNAQDTGEAELIVCKNRKGKIGIVRCAWLSNWMSFKDLPEENF